jgi:hypothetical protein
MMMLVNSSMFPLLLLLVSSFLLKTIGGHEQHSSLSCGSAHRHTGESSEILEDADAFMESWLHRRRELQQQQQPNEGGDTDNSNTITFVVPVCFHVIRPANEGTDVMVNATFLDAPHLQRQLDALNRGFSDASCCDPDQYEWCEPAARRCSLPTGFTFAMGQLNSKNGTLDLALGTNKSTTVGSPCLTRSYNDVWYESAYGSAPIRRMQTLLRQGDATVLNVYFTDLRDPYGSPNTVGGIATFPEDYGLAPQLDGIFVSIRTVFPRDETKEPPETSVRFVVSVLCSKKYFTPSSL